MKRSLFIFCFVFFVIIALRWFPVFTEEIYSNILFPVISGSLQSISSLTRIPLFFPVIAVLMYFLFAAIRRFDKTSPVSILKGIGMIVILFYISWGLNYARPDISEKLSLPTDSLQENTISQLMTQASHELNNTATSIGASAPRSISNALIYDTIPFLVREVMSEMAYETPKTVVVKQFYPDGVLLRFSTAGFYFPFTAECYIDNGLHPLQKAFVAAHECAHGYGIGDEGTCNFIGFLACMKSDNILVKYSAQIAYWRTLKSLRTNAKLKKAKMLNPIALQDLEDIKLTMNRYPDLIPEVRDYIYENFLKLQGIEEGEDNYNRFIDLLYHYRVKNSTGK